MSTPLIQSGGGSGGVPTTRAVNTTAPLTGGGDLSADRTLDINNFGGDAGSGGTKGTVPAPASGDAAAYKILKANGTWAQEDFTELSGVATQAQGGVAASETAGQGGCFLPTLESVGKSLTTSTALPINSVLRAIEFVLTNRLKVTNVVAKLTSTSAAASSKFYYGIYSRAKNKLLEAKFDATITTVQSVGITGGGSVTLNPGVYYFTFGCDSTTGALASNIGFSSSGVADALRNANAGTNDKREGTAANSISGGALPSTLGNVTTTSGLNIPIGFFEP